MKEWNCSISTICHAAKNTLVSKFNIDLTIESIKVMLMQKMVNLFINKYQHTMSCTEKGWVCVMVTKLEFLILSNVECISVKFNCCTLVCSKYCFLTWHLDTVLLFDKQTPLNCLIFYATLEHQLTCPTH